MTISKDFRFPVSVVFEGDRLASVTAPDLDPITVAVPPEFQGPGGRWSPEHLLVASVASCYAVTFAAAAERRDIPIHSLSVTGTGHVGRRDDGRTGFIAVELTPRIQTDHGFVDAAERTARAAHTACLVSRALSAPVEVTPVVRAVEPAAA
ncbi:MAG TPA: OsmC family protein [Gaiellaceae bacterium]